MRGIHLREFAPRGDFGRSDVLPALATVAGYVNQAVVGADPDQVDIFRRRRDRINYSAVLSFRRVGVDKLAESRRHARTFTGQVRTDLVPTISTVARCE